MDRMVALKTLGVRGVPPDVTDEESMRAAVGRVLEERRRIDVLANNAGNGSYGALEEVDLAEDRRQFEVSVFGLVLKRVASGKM